MLLEEKAPEAEGTSSTMSLRGATADTLGVLPTGQSQLRFSSRHPPKRLQIEILTVLVFFAAWGDPVTKYG